MMWNEMIESMSREEMRKLQSYRLKNLVEHAYHNSPFYRKKMQEMDITPGDIQSIDDIVKLPFTVKQDLRDNYPFGLMAVPMSEIVRLHASSGTTGKPIVVGYTRKDLSMWSEVVSRCLIAYGATKNDIAQVSYGYGLFTGGLGAHSGIESIGGTVIPMSSGNTEKQISLMHDFGANILCCTPSYALYLAETIHASDIPLEEFKLRIGVFGAEPWTENMRKELEDKLHIKAYDIYGLTEICGPGVGGECQCQNGTHIWEDHFFPEIVDPVTMQPVAPGEQGELVFTTLTKEGMPMIRYRTRDLTSLHYETCDCGRTAVRMGRILGRSDDMLIIRGVNVFPSQVESVLLEMPEFEPHYFIVVDRVNNTDTFQVQVELRPEFYSDEMNKMLTLRKKIAARMQSVIGIQPEIKIMEPRSIERSMGKAKHVEDRRKLY
ncbi:phenylacetate-CoA ligase [Parabacteroides sp. PFB2-12]|uniref:phenylacetate--CoA ligase family protein n=1 Tax=unclassified Parabacteroides TaxID=2649774 RepID=UPI002476B1B2|nr:MULTISPECIES: phenylacetate--CoA ligase [unclassified Parabacteroides]MDH6341524.1 phenylacetate-CoA ligase [Parabacteroides sp. PM6-13]MDH6389318.1 phenylacetate-CoA ligase [Parabacteroides sp. PFB2-12]